MRSDLQSRGCVFHSVNLFSCNDSGQVIKYDTVLRDIADQFAPEYKVRSQVRPLAPWFDADCRALRRKVRKLERRYRRTKKDADRRAFIEASHHKHAEYAAKKNDYWVKRISDEKNCPLKLWKSLSKILRREDNTAVSSHTADDFIMFFNNKVESTQANTADAAPPVISQPVTLSLTDFPVCLED